MEEVENLTMLNSLIENFYCDKSQADKYKKDADNSNKEIKELMKKLNLSEFKTDSGLVAKMGVQNRESFNENLLLNKLKELGIHQAIKTIEVVDMDELENAIYNEQLDASELASCKEVKQVVTLKVKESKN